MSADNVLKSMREDDYVEYFIFTDTRTSENNEEFTLNTALTQINEVINKYASNYLWHKDEFSLVCRPSSTSILTDTGHYPPHLHGITHFGENIEDEWFIVFLLRQITLEVNDVIVRVVDSDGEFLLIEAANSLPQWANPETCKNKVYLYQGDIHIVTPNRTTMNGCNDSDEDEDLLDEHEEDNNDDDNNEDNAPIEQLLNDIRNVPKKSEASKEIQNAIIARIHDYPEKILESFHRSSVYLPVGAAAILQHKPNLIAPAVLAFCNRDPIDMRACRAMKYFPPENRVAVSVTFTKCLYAMLVHSKYLPDRRTGWNLPPVNDPLHKCHNLGVKIASGFEILAAQAKPNEDIENDRGWQNYLKNLQDKNYFQNLLEHSQGYNNLLNKAKEYYIKHRDSMHIAPVLGQEILQLLKTLDINADALRRNEQNLPKDDDESWLNINPEELDKLLQEKYGQKKTDGLNGDAANANGISGAISKFLNHVSDMDGAEFPTTNNESSDSPVRPKRGVKKSKVSFSKDTKKSNEEKSNGQVTFDPNSFSSAIQSMLDFVIPEDDGWDLENSDSDMSDYGDEEEANLNIDGTKIKNKLQEYMDAMDKELAGTTIGKSFVKKNNSGSLLDEDEAEGFDDIENFKPVDIDMNALKNILESYQSQMGESGPASNMLGPMGVHLETASSSKASNE